METAQNNNSRKPGVRQELPDDVHHSVINDSCLFYILKTDLKGKLIYINPLACKNFTLDTRYWLGQPMINLFAEQDQRLFVDTLHRCFATPGKSASVLLREVSLNKTEYTQWEFKVIKDQTGLPIEILCIGHDITTQIKQQQELQAQLKLTADYNKKLLNFTYVISHNLCSHVANINGMIALSEDGTEEDKKISWSIIKRSVNGLGDTIHNLSNIINIQTNTDLPSQQIYLRQAIQRAIESISTLIDTSGINILCHFDNSASLDTNPAYLESIMLNLLTNAIKYQSPHRPLQVDISLMDDAFFCVLRFKDNGIGIDLARHGHKVFGMYKTFHGNADAKGLGLFIIKSQMEAMGGKIEVESTPEQGTIFSMYFKK